MGKEKYCRFREVVKRFIIEHCGYEISKSEMKDIEFKFNGLEPK